MRTSLPRALGQVSIFYSQPFCLIEHCLKRCLISCTADSEVLWPHCASVHSCNSPPGLWGAADLHLEVKRSHNNEPCSDQRLAAPQNQSHCLYSTLPAQVDSFEHFCVISQ